MSPSWEIITIAFLTGALVGMIIMLIVIGVGLVAHERDKQTSKKEDE